MNIKDIEQFKTHPVWIEFIETIKARMSLVYADLEKCPNITLHQVIEDELKTFNGVDYYRGELSGLKWLLALPDLIIEELKEKGE